MSFNFFKKKVNFWQGLSKVVFRVSFILFLIIFIVEYLYPGFATNWFNPIWFLIISLISVIILVTKNYD